MQFIYMQKISRYLDKMFLFKGNLKTRLYLVGMDLQWGSRHLASQGRTFNFC